MAKAVPDRTISVVGGGWSFQQVDHSKVPGQIIGVNEAGILLRNKVYAIVSMDRLWTENRINQLEALQITTYLRRGAMQNLDKRRREQAFIRPFENNNKPITYRGDTSFSNVPATLNGNNSGVNALNLAYILRPKRLFLFGFDMCRHPNGNPYWYPPYEWTKTEGPVQGGTKPARYEQWAREFNDIALLFAEIGTEVINVSDVSRIRSFRRVTPRELGVAK
jgi:hypothetical protein